MFLHHKHKKGFATLSVTLVILFLITSITLYVASGSVTRQRISANTYREEQAFHASDAGLEFGMTYLQTNRNAILVDADNNNFIDPFSNASITNATLDNGAKYSVVYSNPVANSFQRILVTSTGTSSDGTATRTIVQEVNLNPILANAPPTSLTVKGDVEISGNVTITNTQTDKTIWAMDEVELAGGAHTCTSAGCPPPPPDSSITEDDSNLENLSNDAFFQNFFGNSKTAVKGVADYLYQNNANTNYNEFLAGKEGALIWIDQTAGIATINSNIIIGSPTKPVILVVNGNLSLGGSVQFYGVLYVIGNWNNGGAGTVDINGALMVEGDLTSLTGTPNILFDPNILNNLSQQVGIFAKIAGTWHDF